MGISSNLEQKHLKKTSARRARLEARLSRPQRLTAAYLVANRRVMLLAMVVLVMVIELFEHLVIDRFGEYLHLWYDTIIYMILIPAGLWMLLSLLRSTALEREQAEVDSHRRLAFSQLLGEASSWEELVRRLVEFPHQIAPAARVTLFVYNRATGCLEPEISCQPDGTVRLKPPPSISPNSLPVGSLPQLLMQNSSGAPYPHTEELSTGAVLPPHRYDLPVMRNEETLGVVKLEYRPGSGPSQAEIDGLKSVAPIMALALEVGLLQNLSALQEAASTAQRQQIAQNLHDTLAQNISYLRLKLDQLTGGNAILEIGAVLQELEQMRATADEAYQQVRSTLDDLVPVPGEDQAAPWLKQAEVIAGRANLALETSQTGAAFPLPAATRQQILYVLREALHNVEKHARANRVRVQILWLSSELIIKVTDDGVGFDLQAIPPDGHYGLWIMQHRAREIGGALKITPADECGTEVTLWLPRPASNPPVGVQPAG